MGKFSPLLIGFCAFILVVAFGVDVWLNVQNANPNSMTTSDISLINNSFNYYDDMNQSVSSLRDSIERSNSDNFWDKSVGIFDAILGAGWSFLQMSFSNFGFLTSVFTDLGQVFGIPNYVIGILIMIILVIIGYAIYSVIFQSDL